MIIFFSVNSAEFTPTFYNTINIKIENGNILFLKNIFIDYI